MVRLHFYVRFLAAALVALVLAAAGCSPSDPAGGDSRGNARIALPAEQNPAGESTTVSSSQPGAAPSSVLSSSELGLAYRIILERYVDRVEGAQLARAARDGLRAALQESLLLPMFWLPLDLATAPTSGRDDEWQQFASAYDVVVQKLPGKSGVEHPDWVVIRSMLATLDDGHSVFLTPEDVQRRSETSYAGVGIRLARPDDAQPPLVAEVFDGSPAQRAGLKAGDRVLAADGKELAKLPLSEVVQLIRGREGSDVTLRVRRSATKQEFDARITRATVQVDTVVGGTLASTPIGYLRIRSFGPETPDMAQAVLELGQKQGVRAWVLDLRGNPGGSLEAVRQVAGLFLGEQTIGYEVNRLQQSAPLVSTGERLVRDMPVVVLVDGDSSSGSEILAAALREHQAARIVGATTAGNVGVASLIPLPGGAAMQITEQRFVSPSRARLDKVGVKPDVELSMAPSDLESGTDPQLQKAGELLIEQLAGRR